MLNENSFTCLVKSKTVKHEVSRTVKLPLWWLFSGSTIVIYDSRVIVSTNFQVTDFLKVYNIVSFKLICWNDLLVQILISRNYFCRLKQVWLKSLVLISLSLSLYFCCFKRSVFVCMCSCYDEDDNLNLIRRLVFALFNFCSVHKLEDSLKVAVRAPFTNYKFRFSPSSSSHRTFYESLISGGEHFNTACLLAVWPDWRFFALWATIPKPVATISLPKSTHIVRQFL